MNTLTILKKDRMTKTMVLALVLAAFTGTAGAALFDVQVLDNATPFIYHKQTPLISSQYLCWGSSWDWKGTLINVSERQAGQVNFAGYIRNLPIEIDGSVAYEGNQFVYTYQYTVSETIDSFIGSGMEWQLDLTPETFEAVPGDPVLLADDRGWYWPLSDGTQIRVEFSQNIGECYFERNYKGQIRTLLYKDQLPAGVYELQMTLTLPSDAAYMPTAAEKYGPADVDNWWRDVFHMEKSPVDLSWLNDAPAGKHGFVQAQGESLVFEDGTPARFWGGNITGYALFPTQKHVDLHAKRISKLGFNLMRLHHHDSSWVRPNVFDPNRDDTLELYPENLDWLDYWIYSLKQQGVYIWLDLHVGRTLRDGDASTHLGEVEGFTELLKHGNEMKGYCYVNPTLEALMRDFNEKYLNHVNPYTGLAYKDDPAIITVLVTNENDVTHHFGNWMLEDKGVPVHTAMFEDKAWAFAQQTGLPFDNVMQTWKPGPSKLFLNDLEQGFFSRMTEQLRGLGVRAPIATTNFWGDSPAYSLPSLATGDIIDVHSYGKAEALSVNPRYNNNLAMWPAMAQLVGKPVSVTEWNVPWPEVDRFTTPMYMASMAAFQEWDAMMVYAYSQDVRCPAYQDTWGTFSDPAIMGMMPAAAMAYRQGHVRPARSTYCLALSKEDLYYNAVSPKTSPAVRTLPEQHKLVVSLPDTEELDWDQQPAIPSDATVVTDPDTDFIPVGDTCVRSDTRELTRDWGRGIHTVDTTQTQCASGWIGGEYVRLRYVRFMMNNPKCTVAVTSLDGSPVFASNKMLITAMSRVTDPRGALPLASEPVEGTLVIRARTGLKVYPLGPDGEKGAPLPVRYSRGYYTITLTEDAHSHWFVME